MEKAIIIKKLGGVLYARTEEDLNNDYDLDCAPTVGTVRCKNFGEGIYATPWQEHINNLYDRAITAYNQGLIEIED